MPNRLRTADYTKLFIISFLSFYFLDILWWGSLIEHSYFEYELPILALVVLIRTVVAETLMSLSVGTEDIETYTFKAKNLALAALVYGIPILTFGDHFIPLNIPNLPDPIYQLVMLLTEFGRSMPFVAFVVVFVGLSVFEFLRGVVFIELRKTLGRGLTPSPLRTCQR